MISGYSIRQYIVLLLQKIFIVLEKRVFQIWGRVSEDNGIKVRRILKSYMDIVILNLYIGLERGEEL